ncbi:dienelactone hydrolase family protein [Brevundimonas aurantiaca]|jgi:carboxymethylenebutenolidase|uniref:dienelactone hydrolase family protein n=1 Tax=Brevundimonas aurantiaca TaxID=74316 RepID=UPI001D18D6D0|nr:dienelactone hydrolase family protein [Brevundimonas aurantiaca]MCC4293906.1 dienelactone hydrolase family protein [Brevundimonas aurantiaca]
MTTLIRPEGQTADDLKLSRRAVGAVGALGGLFFSGYAVAALAREAKPITTDAAGLETAEVAYPAPDGFQLPAYVARPAGDGPFPVVIVVSEIFGVHDYIKDVCRRLAKQGYAAIAPAFFVRVEDPAPLSDMGRIMQIVGAANYEQVMGDLSATLEWASQQLWARDGKVGITGFCWGGKVVWQAAARFAAIGAGVAWYGRLAPAADATPAQVSSGQPWPVDLADDLKAPVLGLYGGQDQGIPLASVERMRQALARAGQTQSRIDVYPDAPHGFHADYRASYAEAEAKDGWAKLLAVFDKALKN